MQGQAPRRQELVLVVLLEVEVAVVDRQLPGAHHPAEQGARHKREGGLPL